MNRSSLHCLRALLLPAILVIGCDREEPPTAPKPKPVFDAVSTLVSTWIDLSPSASPPAAVGSMVYDPVSNRAIVFGGCCGNPNDVWGLTSANGFGGAAQWVNIVANGAPPPGRHSHSAVYDRTTDRMIVFGGCLGGCTPVANDVWVLTNASGVGGTPTWIQLSPTGSRPAVRGGHTAVYDAGTNRMIIFGGQDGGCCVVGETFSDVWVLSNANGMGESPSWSRLSPTGGPPAGQYFASATYDPAGNQMIVFGGSGNLPATGYHSNAVWVLSNANGAGGTPSWTQVVAEGAVGSPSPRDNATIGYDPEDNRMMVFGGSGLSDVWVLANANGLGGIPTWTDLSPSGGPPTAIARGVLDVGTNRLLTFGGPVGGEAWVLTNASGVELTVMLADQRVIFGSLSNRTFGEPPFEISASATSGLPVTFAASGNCSVSGSTVTITAIGLCTITATQAGNATFRPASISQTFSIVPDQTITFTIPLSKRTIGDPPFTISASASSGLPVSITTSGSCSVSGNTVSLISVGLCTITADQPGNADFRPAETVSQGFRVAPAPPSGPVFGYVANNGSNSVSVIATASNTVVATVPVGSNPISVVITPDGGFAYVANCGSSSLSVIATANNTVVTTIPIPSPCAEQGIAITPDGALVYVSSNNGVSVIATASNTVVATVGVPEIPNALAVTPNGGFLYVAGSSNIFEIETTTNSVVATVSGYYANDRPGQDFICFDVGHPNPATGMAISPNGARVYVAINLGWYVVETVHNTVVECNDAPEESRPHVGAIAVTPDGVLYWANYNELLWGTFEGGGRMFFSGARGRDVAITPDGAFVYVSLSVDAVAVVSRASNTVVATIPVGTRPSGLAITRQVAPILNQTITFAQIPQSKHTIGDPPFTISASASSGLPVSFTTTGSCSVSGNTISMIDVGLCTITADQPGDAVFQAASISQSLRVAPAPLTGPVFAYVTNHGSNSVSVISAASSTVVATVPVGTNPVGVTTTPDGAFAYVANCGSSDVSVIATASNTVAATIPVPAPCADQGITTTPDGALVYVSSSNGVAVVATASNTVVATVVLPETPTALAVTPNGEFLYAAGSSNIYAIEAAGNSVVAAVTGYDDATCFDFGNRFRGPATGMAATPGGARVIVSTARGGWYTFETVNNTIVRCDDEGELIRAIAMTPDGILYWALTDGLKWGDFPGGSMIPYPYSVMRDLAITPDGSLVYVSIQSGDAVWVVPRTSNGVVNTIPVGSSPFGLAFGRIAQAVGNTPTGSNVAVTPVQGVSLSFETVTSTGQTTVTTSGSGAPPPSGFTLGSPAVYYDFSTTATFQDMVTVCIDYSSIQFESSPLSLFHLESGAWVDRTSSVDETNHIICAQVSSFSPFLIAARKADQTITFGSLGNRTFGDPPFTINATASSGLPVSLIGSGKCTMSGSTVSLTGAGPCTITANQSGNASFNPAPSVVQSFSIAKATPVITWNPPPSMVYGAALSGAQLNASANGVGGASLSGLFNYSPPAGTVLGPGSQTLAMSFTPSDQVNYTNGAKSVSVAVLYNTALGHGFLQPINVPPQVESVFKIGSTIPAKFQLFLADGVTPMSTAVATIQVNKVSSGVPSGVNETVTSTVPNQGINFRYDPTSQLYIFNLGTKGWTAGGYLITALLDDGSQIMVVIGAR